MYNVLSDAEFLGRGSEEQAIFNAGLDVARGLRSSCFLKGPRKSGRTELLRRVYNRLFAKQDAVIPFLHALHRSGSSAEVFCREYFLRNVLQCVGFLTKAPQLVISDEHDMDRIVRLAYESQLSWLVTAVDQFQLFQRNHDLQAMSRSSILFPAIVAARTGLSAFVLVDDLHHLESITPVADRSLLIDDFSRALQSRQAPYCFTGTAKVIFENLFATGQFSSCVEMMSLRPWDQVEARTLLVGLLRRFDVDWHPGLSGFIVEKLNSNPFYIRSFVQAARRESVALLSAHDFVRLFVQEITEGSFELYFRGLLHSQGLTSADQVRAIVILQFGAHAPADSPISRYQAGLSGLTVSDLERIMEILGRLDLIESSFGVISSIRDVVLRDWVSWNFHHKVQRRDRTLVTYELVADALKQSERAGIQRSFDDEMEGIKRVMASMRCQTISSSLLNFDQFAASDRKSGDGEFIVPEMVSVQILHDQVSGHDTAGGSVVVGRGFERGVYSNAAEVAWLAAFCVGRRVVGLDEIQQFHRQCEAVRKSANLQNVQLWLVAEDKFNQASLSFALSHQIFTSNLEQLKQLKQQVLSLPDESPEEEDTEATQVYEIRIPLSADSELVAVRAMEQVTDAYDFDEKAKGQLCMALMEACVNIKEAAGDQQGMIRLIFKAAAGHLVVHLAAEPASLIAADPIKAWGMKMLRTLMDDVKLQRGPAGFELVMTKFPRRVVNAKGESA